MRNAFKQRIVLCLQKQRCCMTPEKNERLESIAGELLSALKREVAQIGEGHCLLFSGGIDSSLIARLLPEEAKLCTVGLPGSYDIINSISSSRAIGRANTIFEISVEEVIKASSSLIQMFPGIMMSELGYETVFYLGVQRSMGKTIVTGQGADELFFGYARLRQHPEKFDEYLERLTSRTAPREAKICSDLGKKLVTPYLGEEIVRISERMRREFDAGEIINKAVLRIAAKKAGITDEVADQAKKAAQFGSGIERILVRNYGKILH